MSKKNYPAVEVEWEDANSGTRWNSVTDHNKEDEPYSVLTRGSLIHKDDKRVRVALSVTHPDCKWDDASDVITIPRGCIRRIRRLK